METKIPKAQSQRKEASEENALSIGTTNKKEPKKAMTELKLITGGKEPPTGEDLNWLDQMPVGGCFLVKEKGQPREFLLGLFRVASRSEKATVLNSPSIPGNLYVDSNAFTNRYHKFEDLGVMITPNEEMEIAHDERDRDEPAGSPQGGAVDEPA